MRLHYHKVDVFTDVAFGGNPLAVFAESPDLDDGQMQRLAKELNLSETTFVVNPTEPDHDFRVRIFTPTKELPMAGHPTIGTVFVLHRLGKIATSEDHPVRLQEGVGTVPVSIDGPADTPRITMTQPEPEFGPVFENREAVASMLSLEPTAIEDAIPTQIVSCGVPFLFVPLRSLGACANSRINPAAYTRLLGNSPPEVFVFTRETEHRSASIHGRMYAPALGITEDPATGGAAGPLGCYLQQHGVLGDRHSLQFTLEQGIEMGRPSFIDVAVQRQDSHIVVRVGGHCVYMGHGTFASA